MSRGKIKSMKSLVIAGALALALVACAAPEGRAPVPQPSGWKAVMIAGDDQEPAFDNAVDAMSDKLAGFGVKRADMTVLKATARDGHRATSRAIRDAFEDLRLADGDGCFVYVTSHGMPRRGLVLKAAHGFLGPADLNRLLLGSCASRPTVVIASGCFSGAFALDLAAPNRVVITAAREDRPSFGCNAGLKLTFFDQCLLDSIDKGAPWPAVMDKTRACVTANEGKMGVPAPSVPQLSIGTEAAGLAAFARGP